MAMHIPRTQLSQMMKEGSKHFSGLEEAVYRNIAACNEMAQIPRTSFGPNGLNKMIVNHLDKLFITNDAATILRELEVQHPAAKMLVLASQQQEREVGDGTNFVMIFAGRLLEKAENLLRMGLSPTEVVSGYEQATVKALEILETLVANTVHDLKDYEAIKAIIKPAIASKQSGYEEFLSDLVAKACLSIVPKDSNKPFNVDNVRVAKIMGAGVLSSTVTKGMVFKRQIEGEITHIKNAKIAVFTCAIDTTLTETKGTVLLKSAEELKSYSRGEEDLLESQIRGLHELGINVIVSDGKFGDLALHFMNKFKMMGVRVMSKYDLRRLARAVGATALPRLTPPTSAEIGHCDDVSVDELGDTAVTIFKQQDESSQVATVVLRGATENTLDNFERAIDDGVNTYKTLTKDGRVVAGAGATEIELAKQLSAYAASREGLEQYSIQAFAEALEIVPFTLAENSGQKGGEVVSLLYAAHQQGQKNAGVDIDADHAAVKDSVEAGIIDTFASKFWGLTFAANAAVTVLRVDQIIMAKPAGGPKAKAPGPMDEDD